MSWPALSAGMDWWRREWASQDNILEVENDRKISLRFSTKSDLHQMSECVGLMEGVVGLVSSRIGVNSNDPPCSHDWVAWVATEGTSSNGELSIASPTGYGLTREDPLRGEVEDAAELEIGIAAAWASRALSLGISGASVRFGDLSETACCILFFPTGR